MVARGQLSTVCQLLCGRGIVFDECGNLLACSAMQNRSLGIYGVDFTTGDEMDALLEECVERGFLHDAMRLPFDRCETCSQLLDCGGGCVKRRMPTGA